MKLKEKKKILQEKKFDVVKRNIELWHVFPYFRGIVNNDLNKCINSGIFAPTSAININASRSLRIAIEFDQKFVEICAKFRQMSQKRQKCTVQGRLPSIHLFTTG